jgi:pimeloyl-ACP methyl ester carboxylesterase
VSKVRREQRAEVSFLRRPATARPSTTVHFAHATGFNAETYKPLFESLDPRLDVYAMDARGHGFTSLRADPRELRTWEPYRRDLEAFVEPLPKPLVVVGHSMGATVSMELAATRPDLVAGLVLIDPVMVPPKLVLRATLARFFGLSARLVPIAKAAARRRMEFPSVEAAVENFVGKGPFKTWPKSWIQCYVAGGTRPTTTGTVRLTCEREWESKTFAVATTNPYRLLARVECPITLVARKTSGPPFNHESREALLKTKPSTRAVILEDATHFLAMERPDVVKAEIERMAEKVSELR